MFKMIAIVEVVLRNSLSEQLAVHHLRRCGKETWLLDEKNLLNSYHRSAVTTALKKLQARGLRADLDHLIPELSFGFWRYLLTRRYFGHFGEALFMKAFPTLEYGELHEVCRRVRRINELRNRIAHHEPIFGRRLDLDHRDCLLVLGAVCPVTAKWAEGISRIPEVLANTPLLR
jgi:hypothetical protein